MIQKNLNLKIMLRFLVLKKTQKIMMKLLDFLHLLYPPLAFLLKNYLMKFLKKLLFFLEYLLQEINSDVSMEKLESDLKKEIKGLRRRKK